MMVLIGIPCRIGMKCGSNTIRLFLFLLFLGPGGAAVAQINPYSSESELEQEVGVAPMEPPRIFNVDTAPQIDGVLEEIWQDGTLFSDDFRQIEPDAGAMPTQRTEVRLMRDTRNLYVGIRCFDTEPDLIIARALTRDGGLGRDDHVDIVLDPKRDMRTGYMFTMNPLGARGDGRIMNGRTDDDWDAVWYGRSSIDDQGWTAEFVIPFRTLSIDAESETWGMNVERVIRRSNERVRLANSDRDVSINSVADAAVVSMFGEIDQGAGISVKPFAKISITDNTEDTDTIFSGGLDLFWKPTPSMTFIGTVNTDFAETEVDQRVINFSQYSIRFPEKRDFFLEDAGYFKFGGLRSSPVPFYSRRIGLGPEGTPETILLGGKLTGSVGDVNIGVLDTWMSDSVSPNQRNYFVGRAVANVLEQSSVGLIFTAGNPQGPEDNYLGGADFTFKTNDFGDDKTLIGHGWFQQTLTAGQEGTDAYAMGGKIIYPNDIINWRFGWARIGSSYFPALGYVQRVGIHEFFGGWRYRIRPDVDWIRQIDFGVGGYLITGLDFDVQTMDVELDLIEMQFERGDTAFLKYARERQVVDKSFTIANSLQIDPGDYSWDKISIGGETTSKEPFLIGGSLSWSGYYGGSRYIVSGNTQWQPSPNILLGFQGQWNGITQGGQDLQTVLVSARLNFYLNANVSWTNLVQYDTQSNTVGLNSRLRWMFRDGQEIFLVFNQNVEADDLDFTIAQTEFIAKVGWTLDF